MPEPETAERILNSAQDFIAQNGYNGFSFRDIAHDVGIKSASVHYHYPTKADLAKAVVRRYRDQVREMRRQIDDTQRGPLQRLVAFGEMLEMSFAGGGGFCLCMSFTNDRTALPEIVMGEVVGFIDETRGWLEQVIAAGLRVGDFRADLDPALTARGLQALFQGAMMSARAYGSATPLAEARDWALRMVCSESPSAVS